MNQTHLLKVSRLEGLTDGIFVIGRTTTDLYNARED